MKFVAKIASDLAKPNGQKEILPADTRAFLAQLPIGRLWGIGQKTEAALAPLGLRRSATWRRGIPTGWNGGFRAAGTCGSCRRGSTSAR